MITKQLSILEINKQDSFIDFHNTYAIMLNEYELARDLKKKFPSESILDYYTVVKNWAVEFDTIHLGRIWDGEYYDELELFSQAKLNGYQRNEPNEFIHSAYKNDPIPTDSDSEIKFFNCLWIQPTYDFDSSVLPLKNFTQSNGYEPEDIKAIHDLSPGATHKMNDHIVTRIN